MELKRKRVASVTVVFSFKTLYLFILHGWRKYKSDLQEETVQHSGQTWLAGQENATL